MNNTAQITNYFKSQRLKPSCAGLKWALKSILLVFIAILAPSLQSAEKYQSLPQIEQTAKIFLEQMTDAADNSNTSIKIGKLDRRLKFKLCNQPLSPFVRNGTVTIGKLVVGIKCPGPVQWQVYIPATVEKFVNAIIVIQPISRGQTVAMSDLKVEKVALSKLRNSPLSELKTIVGSRAKRSLRPSQIARAKDFCLVCKGDAVKVSVSYGNLSILADGIAQQDGLQRQLIRVKNTRSKRIYSARVIGAGQLEIKPGGHHQVANNQHQ